MWQQLNLLLRTTFENTKRNVSDNSKKGDPEQPKKGQAAEVIAATAEVTEKALRATRPIERAPKKCKLAEVIGCTGSHLPWLCKAFGDKTPEKGRNYRG
jgi:hypothetical protein